MSVLNDVITSVLRDYPQSQSGASSPMAAALRSLLAPRSTEAGASPDDTHAEPVAIQQLIARFQQGGFADIIQSWIGTGANQQIDPQQVRQVLGQEKVDELSTRVGLPHESLLSELANLLPTVIDRLTPRGRAP